jgi:hypothetical protein
MRRMTMKSMLLTTTAVLMLSFATSHAFVPSLDTTDDMNTVQASGLVQLVGGDDNNSGGDDHGGGGSDSSDDSDGDDHGGGGSNSNDDDGDDDGDKAEDSASHDSDDDGDASGSNRRKPRVPGGSGCDDAGDVAEHAECRM